MDKVYIYINDCIRWSGGINILIQIISSLNSHKNDYEIIYVKPSIATKLLNFLRLTLEVEDIKQINLSMKIYILNLKNF